jgi:hypothetical protein
MSACTVLSSKSHNKFASKGGGGGEGEAALALTHKSNKKHYANLIRSLKMSIASRYILAQVNSSHYELAYFDIKET